MIFNKRRIVAGMLCVALLATAFDMTVFAVEIDKVLPVAGLDLTLNEGLSMKAVVEEQGMELKSKFYIVEPAEVVQEEIVEAVKEDYSNLVIADVNDYVNIRSLPSEEGEIIGKLYDDSVGDFLEEDNGWYKIESGSCIGYVKAEYCVTGEAAIEMAKEVGRRTAIVTTETLNVRKEPNTESSIIGQVPCEEVLTVTDECGGWIQIKIEEGYGYVSDEYVTLSTEFVRAESREEERERLAKEEAERQKALEEARKAQEAAALAAAEEAAKVQEAAAALGYTDGNLGQQVADFALQFVGNPYVYGGTSLTNGADCSGFTLAVYSNFGVSLPHSAAAQNKKGTNVGSVANAVPGDLIYYSGHIGIYIGNEQIVHAGNSRTGIIVSNVYYDRVLGVRRIF